MNEYSLIFDLYFEPGKEKEVAEEINAGKESKLMTNTKVKMCLFSSSKSTQSLWRKWWTSNSVMLIDYENSNINDKDTLAGGLTSTSMSSASL